MKSLTFSHNFLQNIYPIYGWDCLLFSFTTYKHIKVQVTNSVKLSLTVKPQWEIVSQFVDVCVCLCVACVFDEVNMRRPISHMLLE